jgi:hypothetical protein
VSFGSGFEVLGRLLNTPWTLTGSELQATDYLRLLHVHYNQRFFICMEVISAETAVVETVVAGRTRLYASCGYDYWDQDLYL